MSTRRLLAICLLSAVAGAVPSGNAAGSSDAGSRVSSVTASFETIPKLVLWTRIAPMLPHRALAAATPRVSRRSYYVDSVRGDDGNSGTSPERPWRSLEKANSAPLSAGDRLLLRRRGRWTGKLTIDARGSRGARVVVDAYGTGPLPVLEGGCVTVDGSYVTVRSLQAQNCSYAGIALGGDFDRVEQTVVTNNIAGIQTKESSDGAVIVANTVVDNNRENATAGAFGILLNGTNAEVAHNRIAGSDAFPLIGVHDGAAIEIYRGGGNYIHHNLAVDNAALSELGLSRDNTFVYNVARSSLDSAHGVVTRGAGDPTYGPVTNTRLYNNTIYLSGANSQGFVCHAGCSADVLTMRNNVVQAVWKAGYADAPFDENDDLFYGGLVQFARGSRSLVANPRFLTPTRGNLHLRRTSPAIDRGVNVGYRRDFDRRRVGVDGNGDGHPAPDIGAFEYRRHRR
jgi:hypothetical protein